MSAIEITTAKDNYFSAGLDDYTKGTAPIVGGSSGADYAAAISIRRNDLGLTYDKGILITHEFDGSDYSYNFFPRITTAANAIYKIKCTARIRVIKTSYKTSPVSITVGIGLAGGDLTAVDNSFLVTTDEGWIDIAIIGIGSGTGGTFNFKLGQFSDNLDCLLLCDNWNAEIFDA